MYSYMKYLPEMPAADQKDRSSRNENACCRGPVGDVKLVCLALWRKREYLTFIQSGLLRLATKILQIIVRKLSLFSLSHISSSIFKLCHLNLLHL